jgi:ribosomal-protein-alanine N-acetyltransferase
MLEFNFDPFPVLETERLILRRINNADVAEVFFLRNDEAMMKYIDRPAFTTQEEALELIETMDKNLDTGDAINWALTLKGETKMMGRVCLFHFDKEHYRGELGYMLYPEYHGQGIMQEAVTALLSYGFKTLGLHTIEAVVNPGNDASIKVLERNNFVREAYFRENHFFDGKFLDTAIYSLINPY